jgi:hypothetical protein
MVFWLVVVALTGVVNRCYGGSRMAQTEAAPLSDLFTKHEARLLAGWMRNQLDAGSASVKRQKRHFPGKALR